MTDEFSLSAKRVTYFMAGLNLGTGLVNLVMGIVMVNPIQIAGGIISLFAGTILLTGIIKDSAKFLLVYFIIQSVIFALGTICGLLLMVVLFTVSSQILDGSSNVNIGQGIVLNKYVAGLIAFVVLVIIILAWIVHFLVYVFYDDMVVKNRGAVSERVENTAVRYDAFGGNSDETNEGCGVKFVEKNAQS